MQTTRNSPPSTVLVQPLNTATVSPSNASSVVIIKPAKTPFLYQMNSGLFVDQITGADDLLTLNFPQSDSQFDWKVSVDPPLVSDVITDASIARSNGIMIPTLRLIRAHPAGKIRVTAGKSLSVYADYLKLGSAIDLSTTLNIPYPTQDDEKTSLLNQLHLSSANFEAKIPSLGVSAAITRFFNLGLNEGNFSVFHAVQVSSGPLIGAGVKAIFSGPKITNVQFATSLTRGSWKGIGSLNFINFGTRPSTIGLNVLHTNQYLLNRSVDIGAKMNYKLEGQERPSYSVAVLDRTSNTKMRYRSEGFLGAASTYTFGSDLKLTLGIDFDVKGNQGTAFNLQLAYS